MELKIICQCGQKYKFDVEPVNGRMPFPVKCPICGLDGTGTANTMLAARTAAPPVAGQFAAAPPPPAYQAAPPPSYSAPAPVHAAPPPPPAFQAAPAMAGLKINKEAPPTAAAAIATPPPLPMPGRPSTVAAGRSATVKPLIKEPGEYSVVRGILGAIIGSGVGCGLLYAFYLWAQFRFPLTGCAVGAAAGYLARLMARGTDTTLGFISAAIAVVSLVGTFMVMYNGEFPISGIISVLVCASFAYRISSG